MLLKPKIMANQLSEQEIKNWYNNTYYSQGNAKKRPFEAYFVFLDLLDVEKGKKIIDVACGRGALLSDAARRGLETFGIDISEEAVKIAKSSSPKSVVSVGKAEDLKFVDNTFDYVSCLGALEHFLDMNKGLMEMKRVAKSGARFCFVVPNSRFILWRLTGKKGTKQQQIEEKLLTQEEWTRVFTGCGYEVIKIYKDRWFKKFRMDGIIGFLKRSLSIIIWILIPMQFDYQFVFILKKKN